MVTDLQVRTARGPKNAVDPFRPYHMLVEQEYSADGRLEDVATVFLTNRECPYRCLMCDLWKNTTDQRVPIGAIPEQIRYALAELPSASHLKLYNSGNFFDAQAIPIADLPEIAALVASFRTVIVECHPKLCRDRCGQFQQLCGTQLEVAMGLETSHEATLQQLNKQMTTDDFAMACEKLLDDGIRVRAFVLLRPPGVSEEQGVEQALESTRFAFDCGVSCCAIIPTRAGNGIMEQLLADGLFQSPTLTSLERVLEETLSWQRGRVFADLWDVRQFSGCGQCVDRRIERLQQMNFTQRIATSVECERCSDGVALL